MATIPSKIFVAYRALGFVSNHVPLVTRYHKRHKDNYVITCVGQSFHVYNVNKLGIVAVSDSHPEEISVLATDFRFVYTACGDKIFAVARNKKIDKEYKGHKADVTFLLPFGQHLISVDADGLLFVWNIISQEQYLQIKFDRKMFLVTAVCHPHTYVNKLLVGSQQGKLQLWNIKSNKLVYSFEGWQSAVTCLQQSTAIDVIAIGLSDGQIILHNLALDKTVLKFKQDYGPVTCIGFRSDGHPMMVSGSASGHIALWDLENRKLHSYIKEAHFASVTGLACLPSEPLMVTSAADNSLKVWIFDLADGGARLLRLREGHSAPPSSARFYGNDGQTILSAGQDSTLRSFSTVHDKHNKNLGRASYHKKASKRAGLKYDKYKMPAILKFAAEPSRESNWDNILATHRSLSTSTTWSYQRCTMGKHKFLHERFKTDAAEYSVTASAVDISPCGNFGLVAYSSGHIDMYNLQSGLYRGSFGDPHAHNCTVRGVNVDGLNQKLISAGSDGNLKFWKFKAREQLGHLKMASFIEQTVLHRDSAMLAVALDDFSINIVDTDTKSIVRQFSGHSSRISDMTFRADGRWLITASMDCTIRTWNVPTGRLIDAFAVSTAATSLSMSPCGNFLASTHVGDVGIYLWSNCTLYFHVSLGPLSADYEPQLAQLPTTAVTCSENDEETENVEQIHDDDEDYKSPEQLADELVTLSLLPTSRWLNLLNLDVIKMRNKPKELPKVPKAAPFFLPTTSGLDPKFDIDRGDETTKQAKSHIQRPELGALSELAVALSKANKNNSYSEVLAKVKEMGPSSIDSEIRLLSADAGGSDEVMGYFLEFIKTILDSNKDFELAHSYLALFLKVHGEEVATNSELSSVLEKLSSSQFQSWQRVEGLLQKSLGLVSYLRSATV